ALLTLHAAPPTTSARDTSPSATLARVMKRVNFVNCQPEPSSGVLANLLSPPRASGQYVQDVQDEVRQVTELQLGRQPQPPPPRSRSGAPRRDLDTAIEAQRHRRRGRRTAACRRSFISLNRANTSGTLAALTKEIRRRSLSK